MITQWVSLVSGLVVLVVALCVLNHMTPKTNHFIRVAFIGLAFGEFCLLVGCLFGYDTTQRFEVAAINLALMLLALFDRRRATMTTAEVRA